jgi:hypothetical protein
MESNVKAAAKKAAEAVNNDTKVEEVAIGTEMGIEAAAAAMRAKKVQAMKKMGLNLGKAAVLMAAGAAVTVGVQRLRNRNKSTGVTVNGNDHGPAATLEMQA